MLLNESTKRLISELTVTVLILSCLGFLAWLVYYFQRHEIVIQVIAT